MKSRIKNNQRLINDLHTICVILIFFIVFLIIIPHSNIKISKNEVITFEKIGFFQKEDKKEFSTLEKINIFQKSEYTNQKTIYPGINGVYIFEVINDNPKDFEYMLLFEEENKRNVNMMFKLKRNGEYVYGSNEKYVDITELQNAQYKVKQKQYDSYELFWKWEDSSNDTKAATSIEQSEYKLKITGTEKN